MSSPRRAEGTLLRGLAPALFTLLLPFAAFAQSDANGVYSGIYESCEFTDDGQFAALLQDGVAFFFIWELDEDTLVVAENVPVLPDGSFDFSPAGAAPLTRLHGRASAGAISGSFDFTLDSCDGQQPSHADTFSGPRSEPGVFSDEAGYYEGTVVGAGGSFDYTGTARALLDPIGRGPVLIRIEATAGVMTESFAFLIPIAMQPDRSFTNDELSGSLSAWGVTPPVISGSVTVFGAWSATRALALTTPPPPPDQLVVSGGPRRGILARARNGAFSRLNEFSPDSMQTADLDDDGQDELVVDLGAGFGLWILGGEGWRALSPLTAESIVKIDFDSDPRDDLVVDFGPEIGVRIWMNDTTWVDQSSESPDSMLAWPTDSGPDLLLMDCGPKLGIWFRKCQLAEPRFGASQFDVLSPVRMIAVDFDRGTPDSRTKVLADFGPQAASNRRFGYLVDDRFGLWLWDPNPFTDWVRLPGLDPALAGLSPDQMVTGDVNGNAKDDLFVDFGAGRGVYALLDGTSWLPVTGDSPGSMATGDLDGDGIDELILDRPSVNGIWTWTPAGGLSALATPAGEGIVVLDREVAFVPEPSALQLGIAALVFLYGIACARGRLRRLSRKPLSDLPTLAALLLLIAPAIGNARELSELGSIPASDITMNVEAVGDFAYIADGLAGLYIYDVSNSAAPSFVGSINTPGFANDVAVAGGFAYVADMEGGLRIIDVTNPASPIERGSNDPAGGLALDVEVQGARAYVTDFFSGLRIIDVSNPMLPNELGVFDPAGDGAEGVAVVGELAYVVDVFALRIANVSNPASPSQIGFVESNGFLSRVAVEGDRAYVADPQDGLPGLRIFDVSNPASPSELPFFQTPGASQDIVVKAGRAYVANGQAGLRVIDVVSNPMAEIDFHDTNGSAQGVSVVGNRAYVADGVGGVRIINVPEPAAVLLQLASLSSITGLRRRRARSERLPGTRPW